MTFRHIKDASGASLRVIDYDGDLLQPFPGIGKTIDALPELSVRPDDTVVVGHPRSGNHWIWEVTARLLTGDVTDTFSRYFGEVLIEGRSSEYLDAECSPRVLVSHLHPHHLTRASQLFDGSHKIIYVARNPKDVAVSFYIQSYNFRTLYGYDGTWSDYLELFLQNKVDCAWFDHVRRWEQYRREHPHVPIHFVLYEDLHKDLMGEIKRLAEFLCVDRGEKFYRRLYNVSTFPAMKKHHDAHAPEYIRSLFRNGDLTMFRKGMVGGWKNYFTVNQSERFDAVYAERMKDFPYNFRYSETSSGNSYG